MSKTVTIYTAPTGPDCRALKRWFGDRGPSHEERDLDDPADEAKARTRVRMAPITFIGDELFFGTFPSQRPRIEAALGPRGVA